jgi:tetratricopeptide (TPR) repeat protein
MHAFVAALLVVGLVAAGGHAVQAQPVDSLIVKGKRLVDEGFDAGDVDKLKRATSLFERATRGDSHTALAHYYAGFSHKRIVEISGQDDEDTALKHLDASIDHLESAVEADDEFAEAHALLASVYGQKLGIKPQLGMVLGPKTSKTMKRAKRLAPDNPRVVMMQATSNLFTPKTWGGDPKKAIEGFQRAATLFESYTPEGPLQPDWGHSEAYAWLGIAYMKQDRYDEAKTALAKALEVDPDFNWVKHILLPRAKKGKDPGVSE